MSIQCSVFRSTMTVGTAKRGNRAAPAQGRHSRAGVALILVLSTIAVVSLMAAHVAAVSQVVARETAVAASRVKLKYAAESAADRAFWLLMADRAWFKDRTLGRSAVDREAFEAEPWMMDGHVHELTAMGLPVQVALHDADGGLVLSGDEGLRELRAIVQSDDAEDVEEIDRCMDALRDYEDADDSVRLHGREREDYAAEGYPDLPRNARIVCREEAYWIPELRELLMLSGARAAAGSSGEAAVRILPPAGFSFPSRRNRLPPFFSSPAALLAGLPELTADERETVLQARTAWHGTGEAFGDSMPPDLMELMRKYFSFKETEVVTIVATAASADGQVHRSLRMTRPCGTSTATHADARAERLAFWERSML